MNTTNKLDLKIKILEILHDFIKEEDKNGQEAITNFLDKLDIILEI